MTLQISKSESLRTLPPRKIAIAKQRTLEKCEACSTSGATLSNACNDCRDTNEIKSRLADANIPIRYWDLRMSDFKGKKILLDKFEQITSDFGKAYDDGVCLCFAGPNGIGKTYVVTAILKRASLAGYHCLYTTHGDIVANAVSYSNDKHVERKELMTTDFLVIDEFDPRHMTEGAGSDLFGRQMEDIFRKRAENKLPLFMCTNSPNVVDSFSGPIKDSISSLMKYVKIISVLDKDHRGEE